MFMLMNNNKKGCRGGQELVSRALEINLERFSKSTSSMSIPPSTDSSCKPCGQSKRQDACRPCCRRTAKITDDTYSEAIVDGTSCKTISPAGSCVSGSKSLSSSCSYSGASRHSAAASSNVCVVMPGQTTSHCANSTTSTSRPCTQPANYSCRRQNQQAASCCRSGPNASQLGGSCVDTVPIGTYVHILAIQDKFRPAGQTSVQKIAAVVMYVTSDGQYQLGTRKGIIGRLFNREELDVRSYHKFTTQDVPSIRINMLEASTMAF